MKVFISWSGELSRNLAEIVRQWLPGVIQAVKPYYSPDDITKGTLWNTEISRELNASKIGIICVTSENLQSPWIMFEAGALSKNIDKSKVCPILFDVEPADLQGPLVQFQGAKFSKEEIKRLIKMINTELAENSLSTTVLENVFDMWWPKFEQNVYEELKKPRQKSKDAERKDRELLEEVLNLTRDITIKNETKNSDIVIPPYETKNLTLLLDDLRKEIHDIKNLKQPQSSFEMNRIEKYLEDIQNETEQIRINQNVRDNAFAGAYRNIQDNHVKKIIFERVVDYLKQTKFTYHQLLCESGHLLKLYNSTPSVQSIKNVSFKEYLNILSSFEDSEIEFGINNNLSDLPQLGVEC